MSSNKKKLIRKLRYEARMGKSAEPLVEVEVIDLTEPTPAPVVIESDIDVVEIVLKKKPAPEKRKPYQRKPKAERKSKVKNAKR